MLAVVGTVPEDNSGLIIGRADLSSHRQIEISNKKIPVNRGTPALLGAMVSVVNYLNQKTENKKEVQAFLAGDIGLGRGSFGLYQYLVDNISAMDLDVIVFHYLQPDVDWHNKILFQLQALEKKPVIIADAGFMYAAKMSGLAPSYDLFTPDAGELAFLADETAPHPFYTRGFILHETNKLPDLIARAYNYNNAAKYLLVKGETDYIAARDGILASVNLPSTDAMEAMGGTGDSLTGTAAALAGSGYHIAEAAEIASKVNRVAGQMAEPDPATQIDRIIDHLPEALEKVIGSRYSNLGKAVKN